MENNVLNLQVNSQVIMPAQKLVYYTFEQLLLNYPIIAQWGWKERDMLLWVQSDILFGRGHIKKKETLEIEKQSMEDFIENHKRYLLNRVEWIKEDYNFFTAKYLMSIYVGIGARKWTQADLRLWASQGILLGKGYQNKTDKLEIHRASMVEFIEDHNNYLRKRIM